MPKSANTHLVHVGRQVREQLCIANDQKEWTGEVRHGYVLALLIMLLDEVESTSEQACRARAALALARRPGRRWWRQNVKG